MHALQLVAVVLLVSLPANGQAVPILGRQLSIQGSAFSSKPTRKTLVIARETATDVGTLSDPTMDGARFQLTTTGGTPRAEDFILDAAGWTAVKNGYRYRSSGNPPEVQVQLTKTLGGVAFLRVKLRKNATGLLPPAPGDTALLVLDVAGGERYCVSFGGAAGGTEIKDSATQWKVKNATAEPACPPASSALPECVSEFAPCGTCGDGICVAHLSGAPPYVCASQSGYSAGICSSSAECTAPRDCAIPSSFPPCPGGAGQCVVPCNADTICESEAAGFCASVACLGQRCLIPCF